MQIRTVVAVIAMVALTGCDRDSSRLERGVVAAPEAQAAAVGAEILRRGGNAVDAAIAVQFAICVTNPIGAGIGGGGFMLIHDPRATNDPVVALDYREAAPAAAHRDMFLDQNGEVNDELSMHSPLASGVPGTVRGMALAHQRFGKLAWAELLEPAIRLARDGFVIDSWTAWTFDKYGKEFDELPQRFLSYIEFDELYDGDAGSVLRLPALATTLQRIADNGPEEFYSGETAELLIAEMERSGGLISADDLRGYEAIWREPIETTYRGHRVVSMPPPSSGGVSMIEFLNMFELFDPPPLHSRAHVHLLAEIAKRVFADRAEYLGDPGFHDTPTAELIDKSYARRRAEHVNPEQRSDPTSIAVGAMPAVELRGSETTHFSIVDRDGMAVSNTTTLNTAYGSGIVVDGAGFLLNSQMNDFSAKPGVPNHYGVTGSAANEIAAGKRPLSSMTPTMVFDQSGQLELVLGSPGGSTIVSTVTQVVLHTIDYGQDVQSAVKLPRFHHQWPPFPADVDPISVEDAADFHFSDDLLAALTGLGYTIVRVDSLGDVQAVEIEGRVATGVFDTRRTGGVAYE